EARTVLLQNNVVGGSGVTSVPREGTTCRMWDANGRDVISHEKTCAFNSTVYTRWLACLWEVSYVLLFAGLSARCLRLSLETPPLSFVLSRDGIVQETLTTATGTGRGVGNHAVMRCGQERFMEVLVLSRCRLVPH
ncbi:unnamed protein product, partial [Hapterophycus canaliculatus]